MAIEEKDRLGALLKYEADKNYCRDIVTIVAGENLAMGTVLGRKNSDGTCKMVTVDNSVLDGTYTAYAVLLEDVDATEEAKEALIIARDAIVSKSALIYPEGATAAQKTQILRMLQSNGIVARDVA